MAVSSIQDRTNEFRSVLTQVQKRQASSKIGAQRQSLLTDAQKAADGSANGDLKQRKSEFARRAAEIGRGISATMAKLEKLTQRRTPFGPWAWLYLPLYALLTVY
jgi:syntaxin 5